MHLSRFRPVFALLPLLTFGAVNALALDPDAKATPPARIVTLVTENAINRLSTSIVECAPSTRKTA